MSKRKLGNVLIIILLITYMVIYKLFLFKKYMPIIDSLTASFLIMLTFISILLLGYRKDKNSIIKSSIRRVVLYTIVVFFCVIYALGFKTGFLSNAYSLSIPSIVDNIFIPIVIIVSTELFRYIFISANKDDKDIYTYIITIVLSIFEICVTTKGNPLAGSISEVFKNFTTSYIPIIIKNMCLSYLTHEAGYKPTLIYRMIIDLYLFVMPILPNLGDYIQSVEGIIIPLMIYIFVSRTIEQYYSGEEHKPENKAVSKIDVPFIIVFALLIALVSDFFPHQIVGIASQSMQPNINKGDAVYLNKIISDKSINKGDIIAYKNGKKLIVHRVVSKDCSTGKCYYKTKGDANNVRDEANLTLNDIKGKVLFKIKYIAYPSVWISEWLGR